MIVALSQYKLSHRLIAERKEIQMKPTFATMAILGITLMLLPITNADEVEWFPPDIARDIAGFYMPVASGALQISTTNEPLKINILVGDSQRPSRAKVQLPLEGME
jgi:hypothetical protein